MPRLKIPRFKPDCNNSSLPICDSGPATRGWPFERLCYNLISFKLSMDTPTPKIHLPVWLQAVVASAGGLGLFLIAFLDSSVLTFPVINDLLLIDLTVHNPARMPYYAAMATLGSVGGCLLLYYLARKGGEAMFHKHAGPRAQQIRAWINRNGFVSILVTALLPPPTPFKVFVIAAGALEMPMRTFVLGLLVARGFRFFAEGFLAVKYGDQAGGFLLTHKLELAGITLGVVLCLYLASRLAFRATEAS